MVFLLKHFEATALLISCRFSAAENPRLYTVNDRIRNKDDRIATSTEKLHSHIRRVGKPTLKKKKDDECSDFSEIFCDVFLSDSVDLKDACDQVIMMEKVNIHCAKSCGMCMGQGKELEQGGISSQNSLEKKSVSSLSSVVPTSNAKGRVGPRDHASTNIEYKEIPGEISIGEPLGSMPLSSAPPDTLNHTVVKQFKDKDRTGVKFEYEESLEPNSLKILESVLSSETNTATLARESKDKDRMSIVPSPYETLDTGLAYTSNSPNGTKNENNASQLNVREDPDQLEILLHKNLTDDGAYFSSNDIEASKQILHKKLKKKNILAVFLCLTLAAFIGPFIFNDKNKRKRVPTIISKNSKTCDDILMIDIPQDPIDDIFMTDVPQYSIQDSVEKRADEEQDGVEKGYNNMKSADFVEENIRQVNTFGHENRISIPPEICGTKTFPTREECINFEKNDAHHILEDFKTRVLNIKGSFDCLQ